MRKRVAWFSLLLLALMVAGGWLLRQGAPEVESADPELGSAVAAEIAAVSARAELHDAAGRAVGVANLTGTERGVRIEVQVSGLSAGRHGYHIHETGRCDPPDFASAGGHFNPGAMHHGLENPAGPHGGDLPNLVISEEGTGSLTTLNPYVTLGSGAADDLLRAGGTAVIIHAGPDDYYTDPAGNSGARIVCGVIEKVS
jgi:Cu-Zn family superoxide dismutase